MEFEIGYTTKEITPWGGLVFLRQMLDKLNFRQVVVAQPELPSPGSNRGYDAATIIEAFMASIWCGANRFLHTKITRLDPSIARIFNWKRTPGQDTNNRFFAKFTSASQIRISNIFIIGFSGRYFFTTLL